ncbi:MAG: hypothetical protein CVV12_15090, partial [Gammaproteobacteria bacterium HGW-Gammaproteobacteria-2]
LAALTGWASTLPLTNRDKAKAAIAAVTETTRNLNLTDIDTLRTISMDDALVKAGTVAAGSKKILAIYGLDVDKALASVSASEVSRDGDTARVKVSYTLLDKPISFEMDMLQRDGRWYSASGITRAETALAAADTAPATLDEGNAPDAEADEEQAAPAPSN